MFWRNKHTLTFTQYFGLAWLFLAVVVVLLVNTWVAEDAYITFRVIENASQGYGLRWNIDERVQAYTHPLWLLLMLGAHAITQELYFTSIGVSLVLAAVALAIGAFGIARSFWPAVFVLTAAAMAAPFVDFAAAGLETPLAYVLVAAFLWFVLRAPQKVFWMSFVAGLLVLTRHDFLLLVAPALFWTVRQQRSWRTVGLAALGMVPVIVWELFSLVYYGFALPNTAYAKLNVAILRWDLVAQGFRYMTDVVLNQPLVVGVLIVGGAIAAAKGRRPAAIVMAGVLLYLLYVIWIGGDFMTGRFVAVPFWAALLVCARYWPKSTNAPELLFTGLLVLGIFSARPIWYLMEKDKHAYAEDTYRLNGIVDEKSFYFPFSGLVVGGKRGIENHYWVRDALVDREREHIVVRGNVGLYGYFAGPTVHIIDTNALADPLLSRITTVDTSQRERTTKTKWRIGHFKRKVPAGYVESVQNGTNVIKDPEVAQLYDDLKVITQGPIWNIGRFRKIIEYGI